MEKWIIAVSGGPDSMALLDMMRIKGYECIVAHVNYNKRVSSIRDENIVRDYCAKYNLSLEVISVSKYPKGNFQNIARKIRYELFDSMVSKYGAEGVMTAHHLDDSLETYIMNKNSKKESSSVGISKVTKLGNLKVFRPLLDFRKDQLVEYCEKNQVPYGIDESNSSLDYTRNKVRHEIAKLDEHQIMDLIDEMQRSQIEFTENQEAISQKVARLGKTVSIDEFIDINQLRSWLIYQNVDIYNASTSFLEEMLRSLKKGKGYFTFDNQIVYAQYGKIYIDEIRSTNITMDSIEYGKYDCFELSRNGKTIESLTLSESDFPITFRNPLPGDKIKLRLGTKQVNRFFIDNKIPLVKRKNWLVVENRNKDIVFVVGIGCDIHHYSNNSNLFVIK